MQCDALSFVHSFSLSLSIYLSGFALRLHLLLNTYYILYFRKRVNSCASHCMHAMSERHSFSRHKSDVSLHQFQLFISHHSKCNCKCKTIRFSIHLAHLVLMMMMQLKCVRVSNREEKNNKQIISFFCFGLVHSNKAIFIRYYSI